MRFRHYLCENQGGSGSNCDARVDQYVASHDIIVLPPRSICRIEVAWIQRIWSDHDWWVNGVPRHRRPCSSRRACRSSNLTTVNGDNVWMLKSINSPDRSSNSIFVRFVSFVVDIARCERVEVANEHHRVERRLATAKDGGRWHGYRDGVLPVAGPLVLCRVPVTWRLVRQCDEIWGSRRLNFTPSVPLIFPEMFRELAPAARRQRPLRLLQGKARPSPERPHDFVVGFFRRKRGQEGERGPFRL